MVQQHTGGTSPLLYALDKAGAQLLAEHLGIALSAIDYKPHEQEGSWFFLNHVLDVTNARIIFTQAAAARGLQMAAWYNERELRSDDLCDVVYITDPDGSEHKAAVVPDALFCLQNTAGKQAAFFVEVDRKTVTLEPGNWAKRGWMRKCRVYETYFASTAYKQRFQTDIVPVLTISTSEVRVNHLREATEKVTKSLRFWFTALDQLTAETAFGAIWQRSNMAGLHPLLG